MLYFDYLGTLHPNHSFCKDRGRFSPHGCISSVLVHLPARFAIDQLINIDLNDNFTSAPLLIQKSQRALWLVIRKGLGGMYTHTKQGIDGQNSFLDIEVQSPKM